jgi:excisionase family DNA binding protein
MSKSFIKVKEAVSLYGIGENIFYKAIKKGELKAYKPNCRDFLLKVTEIEQWIETKVVC